MKTEEEIRIALAQVRASKAQYKPNQSLYGYHLGAETMLEWLLDDGEIPDQPEAQWAVLRRTFTDGPFDKIDDGTQWSHRRGKPYTEEEAREEMRTFNQVIGNARLAKRLVTPWKETD